MCIRDSRDGVPRHEYGFLFGRPAGRQRHGNATATPPGCRAAAAPAMDERVRAPGSTAAHSAA
eukprot:4005731-Alexandrium_andersonii.AAC.1